MTDSTHNGAPLEIERKFLIKYPDTARLEGLPGVRRAEIEQTYLLSDEGTLRVREWREGGRSVYIRTLKKKLSDLTRIEFEDEISEAEYVSALKAADPAKRPIKKTRYMLPYDGQVFEIDLFPFWKSQAIMEIELPSEEAEIRFPKSIRIIREVTRDGRYTNAALAGRY